MADFPPDPHKRTGKGERLQLRGFRTDTFTSGQTTLAASSSKTPSLDCWLTNDALND
uniref:Uncharacterized protein n=1 Tax=Anguilla anguilla TaxID=7936 RepID=A0A0E9RFJ6_ANGAN